MKAEAAFQLKWDLSPGQGPLSQQLCEQIRASIANGELKLGDKIPATRRLAKELGVARGTVSTAVEQLIAEGLLEARAGSGTYVAEDKPILEQVGTDATFRVEPRRQYPAPAIDQVSEGRIDLRPCRPSLEAFPRNIWRRCLSAAATVMPSSDYGDPRGALTLRQAIASYLRRARGLQATTDQIIVTNGAVHAMHILASLYLDQRNAAVFEDPGYPLARQVFAMTGTRLHHCPVDDDGLITDTLPNRRQSVGLVYVTPSHQFPIGSRLSLGRRRTLIDWAINKGALIVEDDYDGEFRYDVPPLAPMAVMAPHCVVYCGTFSKTLFPDLRIGFAVASTAVIDEMAKFRAISEYAPNGPVQLALAKFIEDGEYERHILRMRRIYARKRKQVESALDNYAQVTGIDSGLSALIDLNDDSARTVSKRLARKGVIIPSLDQYQADGRSQRSALICGYAQPSEESIRESMQCLIQELR